MGAGKSTTGRQLAKALGKTFVDSDAEIEKTTGASISLIFELEGEEGFRKRERLTIDQLTQREDVVLATGGGAILDKDNRADLVNRGFVVYLHAPIELLVARTSKDKKRPLLQNGNPRERFEAIMKEREPLYRQVADLVVTTDQRSARYVVRHIMRKIEVL